MKHHLEHLKSSGDLVTTYEATRAGFVALALEKNRRATPFVAEARALKQAASKAKKAIELLDIKEIQTGLLTASGVSDKATKHLQDSDKKEAIDVLIRDFLEPAGTKFVEELVYRFLLTSGDTLGGSMRNAGGFIAQCKLTRAIIAQLKIAGKSYRWRRAKSAEWTPMSGADVDIEKHVRGISWNVGANARTLVYNLTVPLIRNNVDMCLFNCKPEVLSKETHNSGPAYIALGELKGGIDPAGADEHWKTARSALGRIHAGFAKQKLRPKTFFIGAAIESKMAYEIWSLLESGEIDNAANLTEEDQVVSITRWLCSI